MEFIEDAFASAASLHTSFYAMAFLTVLPMVLTVPREMAFVYLIAYSVSGACVVLYGIPERPRSRVLSAEFDDRMRIFRAIKLQDQTYSSECRM